MSVQLIKLNSLEKNNRGIWINSAMHSDFSYSDGLNEEEYLINLFESAKDLSFDSPELTTAIQDWASLYHLSAARANLLRNINLTAHSKVLELGCGCGAITRYLAEQGHQVGAVEGSLKRAEIARLRNREMTNVEVICHNFNTLELPVAHYDVVLFIGVLEYAKRFSGQQEISAEQAVIQLLNKAKSALKKQGLIIIAIENRTGLKYQLGALEDHLAIVDVGLRDYHGYESAGIKTYDYSQWQEMLEECGLSNIFYYPFPDYKLPNLMIYSEVDSREANYLSTQIHSTDPISSWTIPQPEQKRWLEIIENKQLAETANSFAIIAAKSEIDSNEVFNCNWCHYDSTEIKPEYRLNLSKHHEKTSKINGIERTHNKIHYVDKSLLNHWLESLSSSAHPNILSVLATEFLTEYKTVGANRKLLDLGQIILIPGACGFQYAKYWQLDTEITVEQQLFHLLLNFCIEHKKTLTRVDDFHFTSIEQIIADVFVRLDFDFGNVKQELAKFEQNFRIQTHLAHGDVVKELRTLISNLDQHSFDYVNSQLFTANQPEQFTQENCTSFLNKQTGTPKQLRFRDLTSDSPYLRFDPCDHLHGDGHLFCISRIGLSDSDDDLVASIDLSDDAYTNDLQIIDHTKAIFKVSGIDPQIIFSLPKDLKSKTPSYNLAIEMQWLGR